MRICIGLSFAVFLYLFCTASFLQLSCSEKTIEIIYAFGQSSIHMWKKDVFLESSMKKKLNWAVKIVVELGVLKIEHMKEVMKEVYERS